MPGLWAEGISPAPFEIGLEAGPVWQSRNDVRIPGNGGTKFSMTDLTGTGPEPAGRQRVAMDSSSPDRRRPRAVHGQDLRHRRGH